MRVFGLDVIRAAAIALVLLSHAFRFAPVGPLINEHLAPALGTLGVELFFALSGFLIGGILLRATDFSNRGKTVIRFWARRWMRTLPAYFTVLLLWPVVSYWISGGGDFHYPNLLHYLTFTQNFSSPHPEYFGVAWSLSIEEWSYLLIPLLLLLLAKVAKLAPQKALIVCSLVLICISVVLRMQYVFFVADTHAGTLGWCKLVCYRFDAVAFGLLAAVLHVKAVRISIRIPMLLLATTALATVYATSGTDLMRSITGSVLPLLSGSGFAALVLWMSRQNFGTSPFFTPAITRLSLCSYSLYLIHSPLWEFTLSVFPHTGNDALKWFWFGSYLTVSLLAAWGLYRLIELPFLRLRNRLT